MKKLCIDWSSEVHNRFRGWSSVQFRPCTPLNITSPSMPRSHTPRLSDFLINSKNFSVLCDFCRFHPSRLPEFYHCMINNIGGGQIFGSSSLCSYLRLPIGVFLSGQNIYIYIYIYTHCSFLKMAWQVSSPYETKNMFLVALMHVLSLQRKAKVRTLIKQWTKLQLVYF